MAITLLERPYRFGFTRNEARYVFSITNPLSTGCVVEIKLFCHTISSISAPPELIVELKLYPSPDGTVVFYANDYFESILKLQMPAAGASAIVPAYDQQRFYWIEFRQITDLAPTNPWVITERTRKRIMLLGGIEVQKFERNNFFINYISPLKKWMTWLPSGRFVHVTQDHYLTWLKYGDEEINPNLVAQVFYTDGTNDELTADIENHTKSYLFHMPAGVQQLGLDLLSPAKKIHYYELRVEDPVQGVLTNPYRFYINYDYSYSYFDWVYLNSISGLDSFRIRGNSLRDIDREVSSASQLNVMKNINDQVKDGDTIDTGILLTKKWKADIGYLNTPEDQNGIADVLASLQVFEDMNGRWLRVRLTNKTQPLAGSDDTKWNFPLEWVYGYVNDKYTPDTEDIGDGDNDNEVYDGIVSACPNPTGLTVEHLSEITGMDETKFSWTHPGNIEAIVEVKEDGTDTWVAYTGDLTGINEAVALFVADGRTMNWRLKVKCPNDDESAYVNGPNFVLITSGSSCAIPTALTWTKGTPSGGSIPFTFDWAHAVPAPNFTLQYRAVGAPTWTDVAVAGITTIINFADDGTEYEWRVKALCGVGSESPYVNGSNFVASSAISCSAPYNLTRDVVSSTVDDITYEFGWDHPGAISYLLQIKYGTDGPWTEYNPATNSQEVTLDIMPGLYYWRVAAECTAGDFSSFTDGAPFQTLI